MNILFIIAAILYGTFGILRFVLAIPKADDPGKAFGILLGLCFIVFIEWLLIYGAIHL